MVCVPHVQPITPSCTEVSLPIVSKSMLLLKHPTFKGPDRAPNEAVEMAESEGIVFVLPRLFSLFHSFNQTSLFPDFHITDIFLKNSTERIRSSSSSEITEHGNEERHKERNQL